MTGLNSGNSAGGYSIRTGKAGSGAGQVESIITCGAGGSTGTDTTAKGTFLACIAAHEVLRDALGANHRVEACEAIHPAGFTASIHEIEVLVVGKALLVGGQDECQHEKSSC